MTSVTRSFRLNSNNPDDERVLQIIEDMKVKGFDLRDIAVPAILAYYGEEGTLPPIKSQDRALATLQAQVSRLLSIVQTLRIGNHSAVSDSLGGEIEEIASHAASLMSTTTFDEE